MKLFHGGRNEFVAHIGLCLTDDARVARRYAESHAGVGHVTTVDLDTRGLVVETARGFGAGCEDAAGDTAAQIATLAADGVDVITYEDEDTSGNWHQTWRLVSERALAALAAW